MSQNTAVSTAAPAVRLGEPDLLRTLALFGVIAQHLLGAYARRSGIGPLEMGGISICFELVRFAVPVYVLLFGMMLARAAQREFHAGRYIGKRTWQLLWPYAIWSAYYCLRGGGWAALRSLPSLLLTGHAAYHLWYVPMIFQFVLLAPLFVALLRRFARMRHPALGWGALLAVSFDFLLFLRFCRGKSGVLGFLFRRQTALFPSWLLYFSAGALCGWYSERLAPLVRRLWPICAAVSAVGLAVIVRADLHVNAAAGTVQFYVVGLQKPAYAALTLCSFVCLYRLAMLLCRSAALRRAGAFCGKHSYRAYLAHVECINRLNAVLVTHISCLPVYYALLFVLTSAASLAAAWLLDLLYDKLETACRSRRRPDSR